MNNNSNNINISHNERLQKVCIKKCEREINEKDKCYSTCVFLYDFLECANGRAYSSMISCSPAFFGPSATKYGELPK